ncbi:AraC family transcriptional regulator [Streptomyces profundus]|uniref:AraC family transcriptional regulator n=1 Tax=Streptomyces profundus TaxID=2867410 RepID=UPI001D167285|nr:AraC family transcriptional regulator [Streptomyces sp. MA3_2.13]UED85476.1 AraC family transcriptional regulator [Streptomyces sp. MA3_2.13]UED85489.1 AraC family transcriptional regulator [Streptomyces sp. MA3_2.13]
MAQLSVTTGDLSRLTTLVRSSDLEETQEIISHAYSPYQLDCLGDPDEFSAWYAESGFPGITVSGLSYGRRGGRAETLIRPQPLGSYLLVCEVTHGRVTVSSPGREEYRVGPGETYVLDPYRGFQVHWSPGARMFTVRLDREVVERAAADSLGVDGPVRARFALGKAISPQAARSWSTISGAVRQEVLGDGVARTNPLVATQLTQATASLLVATQPLITRGVHARRGGTVSHAALRRAMKLIEEHPDHPHTLTDLATAARVSPRALQEAFRAHLDTTPLGYLREVRLRHAHQDLLTAASDRSATVSDIAHHWGFSNLGRFAAQYRQRYGHPPSETLTG